MELYSSVTLPLILYPQVGGIASDGTILPGSAVKLVDAPEMGYYTTDNPPRGEICVKTPSMIDGYFKSPEITAEKFVEGYFLTGDIGVMEDNSRVRIIDRKKNIFKLAQGEFVSPERLETVYVGASCYISQMYIYGNSLQSNIVAVVVPEREEILKIRKSLCEEDKGKILDNYCSFVVVSC
jgi:long-chain acyl-CoA synthetase